MLDTVTKVLYKNCAASDLYNMDGFGFSPLSSHLVTYYIFPEVTLKHTMVISQLCAISWCINNKHAMTVILESCTFPL